MNTFRHDEYQRRQWVQDKLQKRKKVKQILAEAQVSRATLYNWIEEFSGQKAAGRRQEKISHQQSATGNKEEPQTDTTPLPEATLPIHHPATRQRMLLAALEKIDSDKAIAKKLAATLVKRFTLSIGQACDIAGIDEATYGHRPRKPEVDDRLVQQSIVQLLTENPSRSFEQCAVELRRLHPDWTRKQIKRVYREGRLYLQRRRPRRAGLSETETATFPIHPQRPGAIWNVGAIPADEGWTIFLLDDADALLLNKEQLPSGFTNDQLTAFLNRAMEENGKPRRLRIPDKPPISTKEISRWSVQKRISVLTLSMSKTENELEAQAMEVAVSEQLLTMV